MMANRQLMRLQAVLKEGDPMRIVIEYENVHRLNLLCQYDEREVRNSEFSHIKLSKIRDAHALVQLFRLYLVVL